MKDKTLLILAAGMGSRFGGLKQMEPLGPNGEFIIDYSIFDAVRNGFNKIVFIIKEEHLQIFKDTIGKRIEKKLNEKNVKVEYVFQNTKNIENRAELPKDRIKPYGTAHAILCAKDVVKEPFVIINADDFYGNDAFKAISEYIENNDKKELGLVGYNVINTLTENGSVKRGICETENGKLVRIIESSIIEKDGTTFKTKGELSALFEVIKSSPALTKGDIINTYKNHDDRIHTHHLKYGNEEILVVKHFGKHFKSNEFNIANFPDGEWEEIFNSDKDIYGGLNFINNNRGNNITKYSQNLNLAPNSIMILRKE